MSLPFAYCSFAVQDPTQGPIQSPMSHAVLGSLQAPSVVAAPQAPYVCGDLPAGQGSCRWPLSWDLSGVILMIRQSGGFTGGSTQGWVPFPACHFQGTCCQLQLITAALLGLSVFSVFFSLV